MNDNPNGADGARAGNTVFLTVPEMRVDVQWYRAGCKSLRHALLEKPDLDPARHFLETGQFDGADPNPLFLLSHYLRDSRYRERNGGLPPCEDYLRNAGRLKASPHWLFDETYVQEQQPKLADAIAKGNWISAYLHFRRPPDKGYAPHPLFNASYYRRTANLGPDVDAFRHFITEGQFRGLSPHPLFDAEFYALASEQSFGPGHQYQSPLHHFLLCGNRLGLTPLADFDPDYYLSRYKDVAEEVAAQKITAFDHFLRYGQFEARAPNGQFVADDYIWYNPRVGDEMKALGLASPFEHYVAVGAKAGLRAGRPKYRVAAAAESAKSIFEQRARIAAQLHCHEGLTLATSEAPRLSLIMPVLDNFIFTMSLLGQLQAAIVASPALGVEVIVVDNGSIDMTVRIGDYVKGVTLVRSPDKLGYLGACRLGAEAARGDILVFLNNDIELTPGLLDRIPKTFADASIGAAGARIVGAAGLLQEAGCAVLKDGHGIGFGRGKDPTDPIFLFPRDVDYVSGCFLCVRRTLYKEFGGFDARFAPGYYEDTDLCLSIRARGHRVVYDPALVIYHYEYATFSDGRPPRVSEVLMRRNHLKFVAKNSAVLNDRDGRADVSGHHLAFAVSPRQKPRRILFIEDLVLRPERGSGFTASADIVADMRAEGYSVAVWSLHERAELAFPLWTHGVETLLPAIGGEASLAGHLAAKGDDYDVVWVGRNHNFRALRAALFAWRNGGKARRLILDTEALDGPRQAAFAALVGDRWSEEMVFEQVRAELPQASLIDRVTTKNHLDADVLRRATGIAATVLGHRFAARADAPGIAGRSDILFLGAIYGRETPNYDSLRWFVQEVLPLVAARRPGIKFHVAGHQNRAVDRIAAPPGTEIVWHGEVADVAPLFDAARVFVAPTRYAGGLPHKVQNAMANGLPVVCTALLWRQLDDDRSAPAALFPDDLSPAKFASCVLRALDDDETWKAMQDRGLAYVRKVCSPEIHRETIARLING